MAGPPRVATPITAPPLPPPPAARSVLEDLVLGFPEAALVFDQRALCTCLNDAAAQALAVNPERGTDLGAMPLGLPAEVADAILALTDPRRATSATEREVICSRGTGVRRFRVTPHPATNEALLTWSDLIGPQEAARQLAALQDTVRALGQRARADGQRRGDVVASLGAELAQTVAALRAVSEELTGQGWGLPPDQPAGEVLAEESCRLQAVLTQLEQLGRDLAAARTATARDVIEL